jgi:uncharacterized membrane protein YfcA
MIEIIILAFFAGLIMEFLDSFLGGGYGTVLTPLFLILGYTIPQIIPMILLSEIFTGIIGGIFHHNFGNVDKKALLLVGPFAIGGTLFALFASINVDKFIINLYIGLLVLILGVFILIRYFRNKNKIADKKHNKRLPFIGALIGFNKAISGGGFGPILTGGLSWSGRDPKKSVGTTTLLEGIVCVFGFLGYWYFNSLSSINWDLTIPLIIGAILSTFPAAWATHKFPKKYLGILVSIAVILLGIGVLVKTI